MMSDYAFSPRAPARGGGLSVTLGAFGHLSTATSIPHHLHNSIRALLPHQPKGLGDAEKSHSEITFLLVSTEEGAAEDRMYGLSMVWVNPHQATVPTVKEVVKQLTALVSSGLNWPYTLVWLNRDTCHVPLPRKGHLGILPEGGTGRTACRKVRQLEVCQLLCSDLQVIYPVGLNGHKIPLITSLPESLDNGTNLPGGKPVYLKMDILQSIMEGPEWKALPAGDHPSILMASPIKATLPKVEREISMTMKVRELLSRAVLDTSGHASENSPPKRLNPIVVLTPLPHKLGDPSGPVYTSSQVGAPDDAEMVEASLEEIPMALSPTVDTPGPSGGASPKDAGHLQEEGNKALGELLATKSSIDAHWWKLVWELGMSLCQNDSKTTESIKEAKSICICSTQEAETLCSTTIKEAKATCTCSIQEAETICSMAIREAGTQGASQADSLHCSHAKSIQCLEEQAIEEESKSQLDFFSTCQAALGASPVELCSSLVASYHILMGQALMSHPFSLSQRALSSEQVSVPVDPSPPVLEHSPRPKWQHPSPDPVDVSPLGGTTSKATLEGPPSSKQ